MSDVYFTRLEGQLADMASSGAFDTGALAERARALKMAGNAAASIDHVRLARDVRDAKGAHADKVDQFVFAQLAFLEAQNFTYSSQPSLDRISEQIREFSLANDAPSGAEGWPYGEGPAEYLDLNAAFDAECDRLIAARIAESDEDLGQLYANDEAEFMRRLDEGRIRYDQYREER